MRRMGDERTTALACAQFFSGKRVLITGAAGSVGSAVALRLASAGCARIALLDHYDHGLLDVAEGVSRIAGQTEVIDVLCDVRDVQSVETWMRRVRPDIVIHAAALKHVHVGERHPGECILTNLIAVKTVLSAAVAAGASDFLLISTDKAASPVCVMGATKRLAELYMAGFQAEGACATSLKAIRFGNVFASQGSVVPRFEAQIAAGGPVEITHPDMERYFMSIDNAVDLILDVTALTDERAPRGGAYFMEMGEPVSIMGMATDMIKRSGRYIPIKVTGLRPGEKLKEELFDDYEAASTTSLSGVHRIAPLSAMASVTSRDMTELEALARTGENERIRQQLFAYLDARLGRYESAVG